MMLETLHTAAVEGDVSARFALADWLEEQGQSDEAIAHRAVAIRRGGHRLILAELADLCGIPPGAWTAAEKNRGRHKLTPQPPCGPKRTADQCTDDELIEVCRNWIAWFRTNAPAFRHALDRQKKKACKMPQDVKEALADLRDA